MKKSLVCILLISCLMMALSIPAFAADTGIAPYGTPGSGYDQKVLCLMARNIRRISICNLIPLLIVQKASAIQKLL